MDKLKILIVRACKSNNPRKRLNSIHRRYWLVTHNDRERINCLINALQTICENHCQNIFQKHINYMLGHSYDGVTDIQEKTLNSLIHIIRWTEYKQFEDACRAKAHQNGLLHAFHGVR